MNKKKKYETPEMEVVKIEMEDVIKTSGETETPPVPGDSQYMSFENDDELFHI